MRTLGNIAANVVAAPAAEDEAHAKAEQAARKALVPTTEFERMRALEMAKAIREAGTMPAERIHFMNRGSAELKQAALCIGSEISGLDPAFLGIVRAHGRERGPASRARRA